MAENGKKEIEGKKDPIPQRGVYTIEYLTTVYDFSARYLREAIAKGELIASKIGKPYYVTEANFLAWIETKQFNPSKKKNKTTEGE